MSFKQQINIPGVITVGIVSALLLVVLILGTEAWFDNAQQEQAESDWPNAVQNDLLAARQQQRDALENTKAWANPNKTAATIPVSWAMDILAKNDGKLPASQP